MVAYLRKRYPQKTAARVGSDIKIPSTTVRKWLERGSAPDSTHLCRMLYVYGRDFAAAVCPDMAWLDRVNRIERQAELELEQERIDLELAELRR